MLKPVDFQTILPRSIELQRVQQAENARSVTDQQEFSRELLHRSQVRQEQVPESNAGAEQQRVREDDAEARKRKGTRYRRFENKQSAAESEETAPTETTDTDRGQHIDFKI